MPSPCRFLPLHLPVRSIVPARPLPTLLVILVLAASGCQASQESADTPAQVRSSAAVSEKEATFADASAPAVAALTRTKTASALTPGASMSGELSPGDPQLEDGSWFDAWEYEGQAGETLTLRLSSAHFDAYVLVVERTSTGMRPLARNDDGGPGTNAALSAQLPHDGSYSILANSALPEQSGSYELVATSSRSAAITTANEQTAVGSNPARPSGLRLSPDTPTSGRLDSTNDQLPDGSYFEPWHLEGTAGDVVTITLRSTTFDAYLGLGLPQGHHVRSVGEDDDSGGGPQGTDAQLQVRLPESGTYVVLANTRYADETGEYTITLETGSEAAGNGSAAAESAVMTHASATIPSTTNYAAQYPGGGDPSDRYAVLVGIDDYPGVDNDLPSSVLDVTIMKEVLVESLGFPEENVVTILDQEATRDHVLNAVVRHLGQAGSDGVAVFYFSGHGIQLEHNAGITAPLDDEEDGLDEAFVLWGLTDEASLLIDDELGLITGQLTTARSLIILDACHSGTGTRGSTSDLPVKQVTLDAIGNDLMIPDDEALVKRPADLRALGGSPAMADPPASPPSSSIHDLMTQSRRHVLLTAARSNETALAGAGATAKSTDVRASVFTHFLAEDLRSLDASTTFAAMMERVQERAHAFTRARAGTPQTPQLEGQAHSEPIRTFLRVE